MIDDTDLDGLTEASFALLAVVYGYDVTDLANQAEITHLLDELAPNPHRAVGLCCVIAKATAQVLRLKWQQADAIQPGDLLGLQRLPGGHPGPAEWRASQMLVADFNGDHDDVADHAIAANAADDMEALMAALLLQWHVIAHLEVTS
jgi:hypothetical protein